MFMTFVNLLDKHMSIFFLFYPPMSNNFFFQIPTSFINLKKSHGVFETFPVHYIFNSRGTVGANTSA